jgi:homoserine O-acetyltransferase/O-succinyltransferase
MNRHISRMALISVALFLIVAISASAQQETKFPNTEGDFVIHDFKFHSGESLPALNLHYTTLGQPIRNAQGHVTNAVLILHGTGGTGKQFLSPLFANVLFGPGQLFDISRYFIILPDSIGHGKSSKPSDGVHAHFPQYDYDDMVAAQQRLVSEGLKVDHLRLIFGTSMGCMHSFVWGETFPDFMDALMPMACLPVQLAGRNRLWRKMAMDAIRNDPAYEGGEYTEEPIGGLRIWIDFLLLAGGTPLQFQKNLPTRDDVDKYLDSSYTRIAAGLDANDVLYQVNSSRNYNPSPQLEKIIAPVMWINSADDFINPPELGIAEREVKHIKNARFILLPISEKTHGHGTHTDAAVWKDHLEELLKESAK